jgi:hypothetical protein
VDISNSSFRQLIAWYSQLEQEYWLKTCKSRKMWTLDEEKSSEFQQLLIPLTGQNFLGKVSASC